MSLANLFVGYLCSNFLDKNIKFIQLANAEHAWITEDWGNNCSYFGFPYINNCNYDAAGNLLQFIYGNLNPRRNASADNVIQTIDQTYISFVDSDFQSEILHTIVYFTICYQPWRSRILLCTNCMQIRENR